MKFMFGLLTLLALVGCSKEVDEDILSGSIYFFKASCHVYTSTDQNALCVEYLLDYNDYDPFNDCNDKENEYRTAGYNIASSSFHDTEGASACSTDNVAGKCVLEDQYVFFYSSEFTSGEAQTECNTLNGNLE